MAKLKYFPKAVKQVNVQTLGIMWNDDVEAHYQCRLLRLKCQCAVCVDEWTHQPKLDPKSIPADIKPLRVQSVGRYAIKIHWSDGHSTGIYTFEFLRSLYENDVASGLAAENK